MRRQIQALARDRGTAALAAAFYDYETRTAWSYHGDRWFHAASTMKLAVLLAVFDAAQQGRFALSDRLHIRNHFLSAADGGPFRVAVARDANSTVHNRRGKLMRVRELALHMITTSSNLATNLLLDLVGIEPARETLRRLGIEGIDLQRGVEDERAFEQQINNRVTADGLVRLLRVLHEGDAFPPDMIREMREILFQQQFNSGIPAGLPDGARVAHKTGEISTIAHDAGLVFLPDRKPYAVALLTEWTPDAGGRSETLALLSRLVHDHLIQSDDDDASEDG